MIKSYKEIEGWFNYERVYEDFSNFLRDDDIFVEIGVWKGASICFLGERLRAKNKKPKIFAVDTFKGSSNEKIHTEKIKEAGGSNLPIFNENLKDLKLEYLITPIEKTSIEASQLFDDNSLAGVFIDANHTYEEVKKDLGAWYPKIKKGGWITGHDYINGVKKAVDDFFSYNKNPKSYKNCNWCWAVQV